jgi:hypothetical protein
MQTRGLFWWRKRFRLRIVIFLQSHFAAGLPLYQTSFNANCSRRALAS